MILCLMSNLITLFKCLFKPLHPAIFNFLMGKPLIRYSKRPTKKSFYQLFRKILWLSLSVFILINSVYAEDSVKLCMPAWIAQPQTVWPDNITKKMVLEADELTQPQATVYEFDGSVRVQQPGSLLFADTLQYQKHLEQIDAFGNVELHREDLIVKAHEAHFQNQQKTAQFIESRYQMKPSRAHGQATRISIDQNKQISILETATYTTCPLQQTVRHLQNTQHKIATNTDGKVAWQLAFDEVEINQQRRRLIGKHATLKFHNVPIFYSPYFNFSLDDRASGFLFPDFGSYKSLTDSQSAFYYKQPYYFNLAPNYDDTLTALYMENRGVVLENEFRYIEKTGPVTHRAELTLTALNDRETAQNGLASLQGSDLVYGETIEQRWRAKIMADQVWAPGLTSRVLWHESSDEAFFNDIPVEASFQSVTSVERYINANYRKDNWHAYAQVLSYLPLQNAPLNYEKRPEIGLNYNQSFKQSIGTLRFNLSAEATEFAIPYSQHNKPEGLRSRLSPELSYVINKPFGYLKANVSANTLNYSIQNPSNAVLNDDNITQTMMQYALRGGLTFEREFNALGKAYVQTLEPELQYLLVPYADQTKVPLFDTSNKSLDFSNLFAFNRFSGFDRIGDTQQITAALTSRVLTQQGKPLLEMGIGQIFYLQDRDVTLNNTDPLVNDQSDYFVKLGVTSDKFYFASTGQVSQENSMLINANSRLRWNAGTNTKLLLNHTLTNNELPSEKETLALGATFQFSRNWQVGTYWNYDFTNNLRNEMVHAIRYDDCCWGGELSVEETQLENGLYNYNVEFLIEFKGLSSTGRSFQNYLDSKLSF